MRLGSDTAHRSGSNGTAPVVLLATAERWTSTARLALALRSLGCDVALLSPGNHPATICGAVGRSFRYDPVRPLRSLRHALQATRPTSVLPADETVARQLGELWEDVRQEPGPQQEELHALLTRSLGDPDRLQDVGSRMLLQIGAQAEGIPTPDTVEICDASELPAAFERLGSSLVLKADASSGGRGVRIAASPGAAERIYRGFATAPHMPRAVLRGVLHRDWTHLRSSARRERRGVTAQRMIAGVERTAMAMACNGHVMAMQSFEVVHTWKLRGPSSVLRRVEDPRLESAIRKLARRLQITGFCGFDFIVDAESGEPLLLERNARPTQLAHLSFGPGRDLAAAYVRAIAGCAEVQDRNAVTRRDTVALFPQELQRDALSASLHEAYHDVPWESPALVERVLRGEPALRAALAVPRKSVQRSSESGVSLQVAR